MFKTTLILILACLIFSCQIAHSLDDYQGSSYSNGRSKFSEEIADIKSDQNSVEKPNFNSPDTSENFIKSSDSFTHGPSHVIQKQNITSYLFGRNGDHHNVSSTASKLFDDLLSKLEQNQFNVSRSSSPQILIEHNRTTSHGTRTYKNGQDPESVPITWTNKTVHWSSNQTSDQDTVNFKSLLPKITECEPGYWGYPNCRKCECNNNADSCNSYSGICDNCRRNTVGPNCDRCARGYYGNPSANVPCRPCSCPGIKESDNFHADDCELNVLTGSPICRCTKGYTGERCDKCADNFWGELGYLGGKCMECDCNNNIDLSQSGNCDSKNGTCLKCLYNTDGRYCERCKLGYYGDALRKQCIECVCNPLGTDKARGACDSSSGQCQCLPHVTGAQCDRCEPNHWNIASEKGCQACECDPQGSYSLKCDEYDGKCSCKEGHAGKRCDECEANYWGDPRVQCYPCDCQTLGSASMQCAKTNGSCICIKGLAGHRCDRCARGYFGTAPNCEFCGECFETWDEILSGLRHETLRLIDYARRIKETGSPGAYKDQFADIEHKLSEIHRLISGTNVTEDDVREVERLVNELRKTLHLIQAKSEEFDQKIEDIAGRTAQINIKLANMRERATYLQREISHIKENGTQLQAANVEGAFNITQDAYRRSQIADKRVTNALQNMLESERLRRQTERLMDQNLFSKTVSVEDNQAQLQDIESRVNRLENQIPDINNLVCGGRAAVGECDNLCGGAGCAICGNIACDAATSKALSALELGEKTEARLNSLKAKSDEELRKIEESRRKSDEALKQAQLAYERALMAKNGSENTNKKLQELFNLIEEFLNTESTSPEEIRLLSEECLKTTISLTPEDILAMARQINSTIAKITDVDRIIVDTSGNLAKANSLKQQADFAKSRADHILETARNILNALKEAKEAQDRAKNAINEANKHVNAAEGDLAEISREIDQISEQSASAQGRIDDLQKRLDNLRRKFTKNAYEVDKALKAAEDAKANAKDAEASANELNLNFDQARLKLEKKEMLSGEIKKKSEDLRSRAEKLARDAAEKISVLQKIEDDFHEYEGKLRDYSDIIDRLNAEALRYLEIIGERAYFHRHCTI